MTDSVCAVLTDLSKTINLTDQNPCKLLLAFFINSLLYNNEISLSILPALKLVLTAAVFAVILTFF